MKQQGNIIVYNSDDGLAAVALYAVNENVWMN